jgi:hypothetical protein
LAFEESALHKDNDNTDMNTDNTNYYNTYPCADPLSPTSTPLAFVYALILGIFISVRSAVLCVVTPFRVAFFGVFIFVCMQRHDTPFRAAVVHIMWQKRVFSLSL